MTIFSSVPLSVFYCSAPEDAVLCDALEKQLDPFKRNGWIQTWRDREISAGIETEPEITRRLHAAHLILLLVSPDLLTSQSCYQQMEIALKRHHTNESIVIPIIVRPVDWQSTSLRSLQVLPRNRKPVTNWQSQDEAFFEVAQEIRRVIEALRQKVIIAAASSDQAFVIHLSHDLATQGIVLWHQEAVSSQDRDTQDEAANQAIRTALAILLIASSEAPYSSIIEQQLKLANLFGRPVIVVWAAGMQWSEVVPGGWKQEDSIDARGERYEQALSELLPRLRRLALISSSVAVPSDTPKVPLPARNPYKGLRAFTGSDAHDFFGRESLIQDLIQTLQEALISEPQAGRSQRLLAVLGASGSGKSSVVMAGVLPRLQNGVLLGSSQWLYLEPMKPGAHPLEALAVALTRTQPVGQVLSFQKELESDSRRVLHLLASQIAPKPETKVVLLVDQFEELFTATVSEKERKRFIDLLVTAVTEPGGPLVVLLTLRADCYDGPMRYSELYQLLNAHQCAVLPMEIDDLRSVIEKPAALPDVQVIFEGSLADDLLFEAQGQVGALPLLEFTLDQLFEQRTEQMLTRQAYQRVGGVKGALAKHAESTYASLLTEEHRRLARILFLRLIDPGKTEHDTRRRRIFTTELAFADPERTAIMEKVVDAFVTARLLTTDEVEGETTIEVSHEALIREWTRLAAWLREAREDVILQQSISADAAEWARRGRLVDRLYRGTQLIEAQAWAERNDPNADEVAFLRAATVERQYQEDVVLSQKIRELNLQRRAVNRLRGLVAALALLLVASIVFATVAENLRQLALRAENNANLQAKIARSQALAASAELALNQNNLDLALLLSVKATLSDTKIEPTPEGRASLLHALEASPNIITMLRETDRNHHTSPVHTLAFSSDGTTLFSTRGISSSIEAPSFPLKDTTILQWKLSTRSRQQLHLKNIPGNSPFIGRVAFSSDGHTSGIASTDGIWLQIGDQSIQLDGQSPSPAATSPTTTTPITFSADGTRVAASRCTAYTPGTDAAQVSQCNTTTISVWDVQSAIQHHSPIAVFTINREVTSIALSADGAKLASVSSAGITLWDIANHQQFFSLVNSTGTLCLAFSQDGTMLAGGNDDKTIHLWDAVSGKIINQRPFIGHDGPITALAFNPKGRQLASASFDKTVRLWNIDSGEPIGTAMRGHTEQITSIAYNRNGTMLATGDYSGLIILWNTNASGTINQSLTTLKGLYSPLFSPDGKIFTGSADGTVWLQDASTGRYTTFDDMTRYPASKPEDKAIQKLALSSDGHILAAGRVDGTILLWNLYTKEVSHFTETNPLQTIALSSNGHILAAGGADGTIIVWDSIKKVQIHTFHVKEPSSVILPLALNSDGTLLAAGSCRNLINQDDCEQPQVLLWDLSTSNPAPHILSGHQQAITDIVFSPDRHILVSSDQNGIILWDVSTNTPIGEPLTVPANSPLQTDYYDSLLFSPDGKLLASFGYPTVTPFAFVLWDVPGHQLYAHPEIEYGAANGSMAFSPDSRRMLSVFSRADTDHFLLWDIALPLWQHRACTIVNGNLTKDEWKQYIKDEVYGKIC